MGKTYRTSKLAAAGILPEGRVVKESALRKFGKAFKRFTHHQERRWAQSQIRNQQSAIQSGEAL